MVGRAGCPDLQREGRTMKDIGPVTDLYRSELSRFEREVAGPTQAWMQQLRQTAGARFADLGFPTTHRDEWRHTDVASIVEIPFTPVFGCSLV